MAVSFRSESHAGYTTGTSPSFSEPASAANGDALIVLYVCDAGGAPTFPGGWTSLYNGTQGAVTWRAGYQIRSGAPNMGFTHTGSIYYEISVCCLTGTTTLALDSQSSTGSTGNGANHNPDMPSTTAVASASMAIAGGINYGGSQGGGWTASSGYTFRSRNTTGDDSGMETKSLASAGAENPGAWANVVLGNQDWWDGFTLTFTESAAETITVDKWYQKPAEVMRRPRSMAPSGNIGIKARWRDRLAA